LVELEKIKALFQTAMNKIKSSDNYTHRYLPYNIFVMVQNMFHLTLKGTGYMEKMKAWEDNTLKQYMMDMLADETDGFNNTHLEELPNTNQANRQRRLREILNAEVTALNKE